MSFHYIKRHDYSTDLVRMPWSPTQYFPHPLANVRTRNAKPSVANFASYAIVEMMIWEGLGDLINKFRKRELGLDPLDGMRAPSLIHKLQIAYSYLWYVYHLFRRTGIAGC